MDHPESFQALDDLDLAQYLNEHEEAFSRLAKAMKAKTTRADRAEAAMEVIDKYDSEQAEAAYLWGDARFKDLITAFPPAFPLRSIGAAYFKYDWSGHVLCDSLAGLPGSLTVKAANSLKMPIGTSSDFSRTV